MDNAAPQFIDVRHEDGSEVPIAYRLRPGAKDDSPVLVWLSGFMSDMLGSKAIEIDRWAAAQGLACLRLDYSGHGESGGKFEDGTIGRWLFEAEAVLRQTLTGPPVLIGSSMGGWIALRLIDRLNREHRDIQERIAGAVLIAPAWDMTERLMWSKFPPDTREEILSKGVWHRPSLYGDEPYPITRALIEEGRDHLIGDEGFAPGCPIRILQGQRDRDVPWQEAIELMERLQGDDVHLCLVKDGEHRMSRETDIALLLGLVDNVVSGVRIDG